MQIVTTTLLLGFYGPSSPIRKATVHTRFVSESVVFVSSIWVMFSMSVSMSVLFKIVVGDVFDVGVELDECLFPAPEFFQIQSCRTTRSAVATRTPVFCVAESERRGGTVFLDILFISCFLVIIGIVLGTL